MTSVWLVVFCDTQIIGAFSTRDRAEECERAERSNWLVQGDILEITVDAPRGIDNPTRTYPVDADPPKLVAERNIVQIPPSSQPGDVWRTMPTPWRYLIDDVEVGREEYLAAWIAQGQDPAAVP